MSIRADDNGHTLDVQTALKDVIQRTVKDIAVEIKYDEALEAFTEEVRNGDREPPFIYPHGVSIDCPVMRKNAQRTDKDKHQ